jgi:ABC-type dipeptide/oligopeptide/nickel transport system ATPase component
MVFYSNNFLEPKTSVDQDTENLIQSVMKENFKDSTVILLATRFSMIVQCDRVIVMNHGRVVEFDTPLGLLDDPKSKFSLMLAQSGEADSGKLRALAQTRADGLKGKQNVFEPIGLIRRGSSNTSQPPASIQTLFRPPD